MYHRLGARGRCVVFFVGRVVNKLTVTKILLNWVGNMAKHHYGFIFIYLLILFYMLS